MGTPWIGFTICEADLGRRRDHRSFPGASSDRGTPPSHAQPVTHDRADDRLYPIRPVAAIDPDRRVRTSETDFPVQAFAGAAKSAEQ